MHTPENIRKTSSESSAHFDNIYKYKIHPCSFYEEIFCINTKYLSHFFLNFGSANFVEIMIILV